MPFLGYITFPDADVRDYMLGRMGLDSKAIMNLRTNYSITISNAESFAKLPLAESVDYRFAEGGGSWAKGSTDALSFTWKRTINDAEAFRHFTGLAVDGKALETLDYSARAGSVIADLTPQFLNSLQ